MHHCVFLTSCPKLLVAQISPKCPKQFKTALFAPKLLKRVKHCNFNNMKKEVLQNFSKFSEAVQNSFMYAKIAETCSNLVILT